MIYDLNKLYPIIPRANENAIVFSRLSAFDFPRHTSYSTGLKFVLDGQENYFLDNKKIAVKSGHFLLVNAGHTFEASIPKGQVATGLCIDINNHIINEAFYGSSSTEELLLDNGFFSDSASYNFFEDVQRIESLESAHKLIALTRELNNDRLIAPAENIFYEIAASLVKEDKAVKKIMNAIESKKKSTREELYRRIKIAKTLIDESLFITINLDDLARSSSLSKFHLIRLFKNVYGISPYQYQLKKKLEYAATLLQSSNKTVNEIAYLLNYPDQQSFNKSFKNIFGTTPDKFRTDTD